MFRSQPEAIRVGIWLVTVAAVAGLLVLFLHGSAGAAEPMNVEEVARLLMERDPISAEERVAAARTVLREDRLRRLRKLSGTVLDASFRLWSSASPLRALSATHRVFREVKHFRRRSPAEDRALELLEAALATGADDPRLERLYQQLAERERREYAEARLDAAERALHAGHLRLARLRAERSLELQPDSERAAALLAELVESRADADRAGFLGVAPATLDVAPEMRDWEASLAAALLKGDWDRALEFDPPDRDADFARAVARYLAGDEEQAMRSFQSLSQRDDFSGRVAHEWVSSPELNAGLALERAESRYRLQRRLGWIGGPRLAEQSRSGLLPGYRAWKQVITPLNLAVAAPWRMYRGWRVDASELREASLRYLDARPDGKRSAKALEWLEELGSAPRAGLDPHWDDGRFVLPRARTPYTALAPCPLLATRDLLDSEFVGDVGAIRTTLGDAEAVRIALRREAFGSAQALPRDAALRLLSDLAHGLEGKALAPLDGSRASAVEAIRRLDSAVHAGGALVVEAWWPQLASGREALSHALLGGEARTQRALQLAGGSDDLTVSRGFGRAGFRCPVDTVCIDRARRLQGALYGSLDLDADFRIGARTSFKRARVDLKIDSSGPQASFVVPLGRWLHIDRWVPLEARFAVGLGGVRFGPRFADSAVGE